MRLPKNQKVRSIELLAEKGFIMEVTDIRAFIPSKDYEVSQSFYQALGFKMAKVSDDLSVFELGTCTFFLQRYYNKEFAENLMFQLVVPSIEMAYEVIKKVQGFGSRIEPVKVEPWGKVIYLWGPSGELWHVTELS